MTLTPQITLINPKEILRTELHNSGRVEEVYAQICSEHIWRVPLTVEKNSYALMDGHHRLQVALLLGLDYVPCILLDYNEVKVISRRPDIVVTPKSIIQRAVNGDLYPEKTTRHIFEEEYSCFYPLNNLRLAKSA